MPVEAVLAWMAERSVPNGLLLVAALTSPAAWSALLVEAVRSQFGDDAAEAVEDAEAEG